MTTEDKSLVNHLKKILAKKYPKIISDIILYGSRITKDKVDSDLDIIILTSREVDWRTKRAIKNVVYEIGIENDIVFDPKVFSYYEFNNKYKYHPFFLSVEKTGVYI